jgi:hypothetical protein
LWDEENIANAKPDRFADVSLVDLAMLSLDRVEVVQ